MSFAKIVFIFALEMRRYTSLNSCERKALRADSRTIFLLNAKRLLLSTRKIRVIIMENFLICGWRGKSGALHLVHKLKDVYAITQRYHGGRFQIVQQRCHESWDYYIHRAQRICKGMVQPRQLERFLDVRHFCSLEYGSNSAVCLRAFESPTGRYELPCLNRKGKKELKTVNIIQVQMMYFPPLEIYIPLTNIPLEQIHGNWVLVSLPGQETFWECAHARIGEESQRNYRQKIKLRRLTRKGKRTRNNTGSYSPVQEVFDLKDVVAAESGRSREFNSSKINGEKGFTGNEFSLINAMGNNPGALNGSDKTMCENFTAIDGISHNDYEEMDYGDDMEDGDYGLREPDGAMLASK